MKLGLVIQYYDSRNDVRELVAQISKLHTCCIFASEQDCANVKEPIEKRSFSGNHKSFKARLLRKIFHWFGTIPKSHNNFLITEMFKLSWLNQKQQKAGRKRLQWRMRLPNFFHIERLHKLSANIDQTPIEDIDAFLFITEICNDFFLAKVLKTKTPAYAYVYSWDHPCKHTNLPRNLTGYFTWNSQIAEDLHELLDIPTEKIISTGATQLSYIADYLNTEKTNENESNYIIFGCSVGYPEFVTQEVKLISKIANILKKVSPSTKLIVRPYPFLGNWKFYDALREHSNIEFDDEYRKGKKDKSLTNKDIWEKLHLMDNALAFLHTGTTLGLECCYLNCPSLFIDLEDFNYGVDHSHPLHLSKFIHQYQLDKYLNLDSYPNTIRKTEDLEPHLKEVTSNPSPYLPYNNFVASNTPLRKLEDIAKHMVQAMQQTSI
ncbi:hypothetical protein MLD52_15220 [Puniceicoccaceae bacterium K14]|nr:hypothetical protein [Puniceicoccaceae bacterium K14]